MTEEYLYIKLSGISASFRIPTLVSGAQLSLTAPSYSTILGMLSYATGKEVTINDTRIGFRYSYESKSMDLEKIHRWGRSNAGSYSYNKTNIRNREVHYFVTLELVLDNTELFDSLDNPSRSITLGRSQDLATIDTVRLVKGKTVEKGELWGTLLPIAIHEDIPASGVFFTLPEYFDYLYGKVRRPMNIRTFIALSQYSTEVEFDNLIALDDTEIQHSTFYIHSWLRKDK
ncbi:MAG: CRISPR-associated protein Cas5 [Candidatus Heimdallarchaeota archaeon]|nr:CRISPR-associated protein Cas5 [Candidatus Heimdallarchaeota archaeon]MDH5645346.1 CRISPR-associated protein Cas5 [Candidatus Heimdallarchaeota archaeon]